MMMDFWQLYNGKLIWELACSLMIRFTYLLYNFIKMEGVEHVINYNSDQEDNRISFIKDGSATAIIQQKNVQNMQMVEVTSCGLYIFFSYLYFIQGFMIGMIKTIPYIYSELPDVDVMLVYSSVAIPSSLKFVVGPFLQKFANINYGKRKTWIILAEISIAFIIFTGSFYTQFQNSKVLAIFCFFIQFLMIFTNIALHALIVKQIKNSHRSSWIHSFAELLGILLGGLVLLKLTSNDFAQFLGLSHQIATPQLVLICVSVFILVPIIIIHFKFKERELLSEVRSENLSFCQIIKTFNVFLRPKTKFFRYSIFIFAYLQGLNFFTALYDYELISSGFSKNTLNTINNVVIVPILFLTFTFKKAQSFTQTTINAIMLSTSLTVIISLVISIFFPTDVITIAILVFLLTLLDSWRFYSFSVITNDFPLHALTGMYLTVFASFFNFGKLTFFHTLLCKYFGWKIMAIIGLCLQIVIIIYSPRFYSWVQTGDLNLPKQIQAKVYKTDSTYINNAQQVQ